MIKTSTFLTVCFVFFLIGVYGQEPLRPPRHAIKFSPLHLVNPELGSVQIAYEHRFAERFSVQIEGGYVFGDIWWSTSRAKAHGVKMKEDLRWYFYARKVTKGLGKNINTGMYLAFELHQNRIEIARQDEPAYRQTGQGIKAGYIRHSAWGFLFDVNFGFSLANTNIAPLGIPLNNYQLRSDGYKVVLPIVGFRLGSWL